MLLQQLVLRYHGYSPCDPLAVCDYQLGSPAWSDAGERAPLLSDLLHPLAYPVAGPADEPSDDHSDDACGAKDGGS
jgi:hypothetical protein